MLRRFIPISFLLCLGSMLGFAQRIETKQNSTAVASTAELRNSAAYFLRTGQYAAAVNSYEQIKAADCTKEDSVHLAEAKLKNRDYAGAEELFLSILQNDSTQPAPVYFYLGDVYRALGNYDKTQAVYNSIMQKFAGDAAVQQDVQQRLRVLSMAKDISSREFKFNVTHWTGHQQPDHVLSLSPFQGSRMIVTGVEAIPYNRNVRLANEMIIGVDTLFVNRMFQIDDNSLVKLPIEPSDVTYNIGSPSWNSDSTKLYYTICSQFEDQNNCAIYYSEKRANNQWSDPIKLNEAINPPGASSKYPFVTTNDAGEEILFFSSNREGGFGGMDLWVSKMAQGSFPVPTNMGKEINTTGDEVTPNFDPYSGILFFSSNGHAGLGQMDVLMVRTNLEGAARIYNLGSPVNSSVDDYFFYLHGPTSRGYLTSNRESSCCDQPYRVDFIIPFYFDKLPDQLVQIGGFEASDAPFNLKSAFQYKKLVYGSTAPGVLILEEESSLIGLATIDGAPAESKNIMLTDHDGKVVGKTVTDTKGNFEFRHLQAGERYGIVLDEKDSGLDVTMSIQDKSGNVKDVVSSDQQAEMFRYKNLDDYAVGVWTLQTEDADFVGQLSGEGKDLNDKMVFLVNGKGEIIDSVRTNANGTFHFRKLDAGDQYAFVLEEGDEDIDINVLVTDQKGNAVARLNNEADREVFKYRNLSDYESGAHSIDVEDATLAGTLSLGEAPASNKKVLLVDHDGKVIDTATSDANGKFQFRELPSKGQYTFVLAEEDEAIKMDVVVVNDKGSQVDSFSSTTNPEAFRYRELSAFESGAFTLPADDLAISGVAMMEDKPASNKEVLVVDKRGNVVDKVKTDENGKFEFRTLPGQEQYSFVLSEDDPAMTVSVVVTDKEGDVVQRINNKSSQEVFAYRNLDDVESGTVQLDAAESTISGTILDDGKPAASKKIYLVNEKGQVIDEANTDEKGEFKFKELPSSGNYSFLMDEKDDQLDVLINIADDKHKSAAAFNSDERKEVFAFRTLDDVRSSVVTISADDATISGMVIADDGNPLSNRKVYLVDEKKKVQQVTATGKGGDFEFRELQAGDHYGFMLDARDTESTIRVLIRDKDGKVLDAFSSDNRAELFGYKARPAHAKPRQTYAAKGGSGNGFRICGTLLDHGLGVSDHTVRLFDKKGNLLGCATTNNRGEFDFGVVSFSKVNSFFLLDECDEFLNLEFEAQNKNGGTVYKFSNKANRELFKYQQQQTYEPQVKI